MLLRRVSIDRCTNNRRASALSRENNHQQQTNNELYQIINGSETRQSVVCCFRISRATLFSKILFKSLRESILAPRDDAYELSVRVPHFVILSNQAKLHIAPKTTQISMIQLTGGVKLILRLIHFGATFEQVIKQRGLFILRVIVLRVCRTEGTLKRRQNSSPFEGFQLNSEKLSKPDGASSHRVEL